MMRAVLDDDGHVGEEPGDQAGADGGAVHRRDDRLRALEEVDHQVAGLPQGAEAHVVVVDGPLDELEAAAGREGLPGALQEGDTGLGVAIDGPPDVGELAVGRRPDGVQPGGVEGDAQHAGGRPIQPQLREPTFQLGH